MIRLELKLKRTENGYEENKQFSLGKFASRTDSYPFTKCPVS